MLTPPATRADARLIVFQATAAMVTLLLALAIVVIMPASAPLADGWRTPIIAFELARSLSDLEFLTGAGAEPLRTAFDRGHRFDMVFPFAYAGLLFLVLVEQCALSRQRLGAFVVVAALLGIMTIGFDLLENVVLMKLTDGLRQGDNVSAMLPDLHLRTWGKWAGIASSLLCIGIVTWPRSKLLTFIAVVPAALTAIAFASGAAPAWGEAMAISVTLCIGCFAFRALTRVPRLRQRAPLTA